MAGELKQVEVGCPCCRARLAVDVRTAKVVRWSRPEETDPSGRPKLGEGDWARADDRVRGRLESASDAFGSALEKERRRSKDLDDLFREASGRALGRGGPATGESGVQGGSSEGEGGGSAPDREEGTDRGRA